MASKRPKSRLAPADPLKREIQSAFDEDSADDRYRTGHGRFDGCGYVGAEAYFHLAGGKESGLRSMQLTYRGRSRWWLEDAEGRVIDLALAPRETSALPLPPRPAPAGSAGPQPGSRALPRPWSSAWAGQRTRLRLDATRCDASGA